LFSLQAGEAEVRRVRFSPDGRALGTAVGDTIKIWDATTEQTATSLQSNIYENMRVISPDGQSTSFGGLSDFVPNIKPLISADGNFTAAVRETATVRRLSTGREVVRTNFEIDNWYQARLSGDGSLLAIYHAQKQGKNDAAPVSGSIRLLRTSAADEKLPLGLDGELLDMAFNPVGWELAILQSKEGESSPTLQLWSLNGSYSQRLSISNVNPHQNILAFDPTGALLAAGSSREKTSVQVWIPKLGTSFFLLQMLADPSHHWLWKVATISS
jgi:hypothetical protein